MDNCKKFLSTYKLKDVEGILLDFDGTIVPSEKIFLNTWQKVFENNYQCSFTDKEYSMYELEKDTGLIDYLIACNRLDSRIEKSVLMENVYNQYIIEFNKMLQDMDFSNELDHIAMWKNAGIKLGIVSTSKRNYIELFFEQYEHYKKIFSCILCREDVTKLKPNPMVYLLAAEHMKLETSKCLVIEDSIKGLEGAVAAHMKVVRVIANTIDVDINMANFDIPILKSVQDIVL